MLSKLRFLLVCITLIFCGLVTAHAATLNVGPGQAYTTVQSAIAAANTGDTVLVAPGTYYENIDFLGKAITVTSSGGAAATIIDGGQNAGKAVVTMDSNETRSSLLSNFTIQHGGESTFGSALYGGIFSENSSPSIVNNIIINNSCVNVSIGGPALFQGNTVGAVNLTTYSDYCGFRGTGMLIGGSGSIDPHIQLDIVGNIIENSGGIVNFGGNGDVIMGNTIRNNTGEEGAVWIANSTNLIFVDNLIYGNKAAGVSQYPQGAGGMTVNVPSYSSIYYGIIANNTFANNTASSGEYVATQFFIDGDISAFIVSNNIFYGSGNLPALACDGLYAYLSGPATFTHNDAFNPSGFSYDSTCGNNATSNGNTSRDPLFVNPSGNDYHLTSSSPLIDMGDNSVIPNLSQYAVSLMSDFGGSRRLQDTTGTPCAIIDIGAYEYAGTVDTCLVTETLQSSLNPSPYQQTVTFTATLASPQGPPTGSILFTDGSTTLGTQTISTAGVSTFSTGQLTVGSHLITATYQPTGTFNATSAALTQIVTGYPTSNTITNCPKGTVGLQQDFTLLFTVTSPNGSPTGSLSFTDNAISHGPFSLINGSANFLYVPAILGLHTITATYIPTGAFSPSSATCTFTVIANPTKSVLTATPTSGSYGTSVLLTATVTPNPNASLGNPTGTVTFFNGSTSLGTSSLSSTAVATLTTSSLAAGTDNLTCTYSGDSFYAASPCNIVPVTITPIPLALTLTSSPNPSPLGQNVTFTTVFAPTFPPTAGNLTGYQYTGNLTLYDGTTVIGQLRPSVSGYSFSLSTLSVGTHNINAVYAGDSLFASATSNIDVQVVTAAVTSTTLTASPNPAYQSQLVTLTANVAGSAAPSGSVTFYDAATALGTASVNASGQATLTTTSLAVGTHPLTATFVANSSFASSTSPTVSEVILPASFTIALNPASLTLSAGQVGSSTITLGSIGNFSGPLALTFANLPTNSTATITPATVNLTTGGTANATFALNTILKAANAKPPQPGARMLPAIFAASLLLLPLAVAHRKRFARILALLAFAALFQTLTGCTNSYYLVHSVEAGTYQIPITATDMNHDVQSATLTLTVTP